MTKITLADEICCDCGAEGKALRPWYSHLPGESGDLICDACRTERNQQASADAKDEEIAQLRAEAATADRQLAIESEAATTANNAYDRIVDALYAARPWPKDEAPDPVNLVQDMAADLAALQARVDEVVGEIERVRVPVCRAWTTRLKGSE